jgi:hypothetical protein
MSPTSMRWDANRAKKRNESQGRDPRTCLWCRKGAEPRFMYCSDACSAASRAEIRAQREKGDTKR